MAKSQIGLDLKQFKHVKSDDKTVTLQHKQGHTLTLALNALSKDAQAQLKALSTDSATKKPIKMADGGKVPNYETMGEEVTPSIDQMVEELPKYTPEEAQRRKEQEAYNQAAVQQMFEPKDINFIENPNTGVKRHEGFGPSGEAPKDFDPELYRQAQDDLKNPGIPEGDSDPAQMQADNETRVAAGLPPLPIPGQQAIEPQATLGQPAAPQATPQGLAPQGMPQASGMGDSLAGINLEMQARQKYAQDQLAVAQNKEAVQQEAQQVYQAKFQEIDNARKENEAALRDAHVSPDNYWVDTKDPITGKISPGHSKIAAAIGMIVAGFNPTTRPNAAIDMLKYQMDQNLKAQELNLGKQKSVLEFNMRQYGNLKDATEMTRIMQNDAAAIQLEQAAANAASPMAKAAALQASGKLKTENEARMAQFSKAKAISDLTSIASKDPKQSEKALEVLGTLDPKAAADLRERQVPGIGFAKTNEDAKTLKDMNSGVMEAKSGINELLKLANKPLSSINLKDRAKAQTLQQTLVGALRLPITGPGAMNEGEREMLQNIIADPTAIFSLDSNNKVRLKTLVNTLDQKFAAAAKARGLSAPETASSSQYTEGQTGRTKAGAPVVFKGGKWVPNGTK